MTPRKITPKELSLEAERLIEAGEMLNAVEEAREKLAGKISVNPEQFFIPSAPYAFADEDRLRDR